jgi:signal transduction histidine kinase
MSEKRRDGLGAANGVENSQVRTLESVFGEQLNLQGLYSLLGEAIRSEIEYDRFSISLRRYDGLFERVFIDGLKNTSSDVGTSAPNSEIGYARASDGSIAISSPSEHIDNDPGMVELGLKSWSEVQINGGGAHLGYLSVRSQQIDKYGPDELDVLRRASNLLYPVLLLAPLNDNYRKSALVQLAIGRLSDAARELQTVNDIYELIAEELKGIIKYDRLAISRFDFVDRILTIDYVDGVSLPDEKIGDSIPSDPAEIDWGWFLENTGQDPNPDRDNTLENFDLVSWIQAPIGIGSENPDGFLSVRRSKQKPYGQTDSIVLAEIAKQITPIIHSIRVREQLVELRDERDYSELVDFQNKELEKLESARTEFLTKVSHELRTPLTTISAFGDILHRNRKNNLDAQDTEHVAAIRRATAELKNLVDDLLDLSQSDAGYLRLDASLIDIGQLIKEFVGDLGPYLAIKNQRIRLGLPKREKIGANVDRNRILQVLHNLVSNACKYSDPDTEIGISVLTKDTMIQIEISDSGIGIAENEVDRIFEPFFRSADPRTRIERGTGLGLSVVKSIVEAHDGQLEITSDFGVGTIVRFSIPIERDEP